MATSFCYAQGTMTMGREGLNGVRTSDKQECQDILNTYFKYGSELDTARLYGDGTTEEVTLRISNPSFICSFDKLQYPSYYPNLISRMPP